MSRSDKRFWLLMLAIFGLTATAIALVLRTVRQAQCETAAAALGAPVLELGEACGQDGPAWIRVRLEAASPALPLTCFGRPCLWKVRETRREEREMKMVNGKMKMQTEVHRDRGRSQSVPLRLVASASQLDLTDWSRLEIEDDLLGVVTPEMVGEAPPPGADVGAGEGVLQSNQRDLYLPAGGEVWLLAGFAAGRPEPFVRGKVLITGRDRETWGRALLAEAGWLFWLQAALFVAAGALGLAFAWLLLRVRVAPE